MGRIFSEEHRRKIGEANRRRVITEETKKKIGETRKKLFATNPQVRVNLKASLKGRVSSRKGAILTEETKQKIRLNRKGKCCGEANANYGRTFSAEHRRKISESRKGKANRKGIPQPESAKEKLRIIHTGMKASDETKHKMSVTKCKQNNPNWRGGISFYPYCPKFDEPFKENVRNFFGGKCVFCGKTKEENGNAQHKVEKLSVHHVFTEKMSCCETKIKEMEEVRKRLPKEIAQPGNPSFSDLEIKYIRMVVPLCRSEHGFAEGENPDIEFEKSVYRKKFVDIINNKYGGNCYTEKEDSK